MMGQMKNRNIQIERTMRRLIALSCVLLTAAVALSETPKRSSDPIFHTEIRPPWKSAVGESDVQLPTMAIIGQPKPLVPLIGSIVPDLEKLIRQKSKPDATSAQNDKIWDEYNQKILSMIGLSISADFTVTDVVKRQEPTSFDSGITPQFCQNSIHKYPYLICGILKWQTLPVFTSEEKKHFDAAKLDLDRNGPGKVDAAHREPFFKVVYDQAKEAPEKARPAQMLYVLTSDASVAEWKVGVTKSIRGSITKIEASVSHTESVQNESKFDAAYVGLGIIIVQDPRPLVPTVSTKPATTAPANH